MACAMCHVTSTIHVCICEESVRFNRVPGKNLGIACLPSALTRAARLYCGVRLHGGAEAVRCYSIALSPFSQERGRVPGPTRVRPPTGDSKVANHHILILCDTCILLLATSLTFMQNNHSLSASVCPSSHTLSVYEEDDTFISCILLHRHAHSVRIGVSFCFPTALLPSLLLFSSKSTSRSQRLKAPK